MMKVAKDGRPWGKWVTSSRKELSGIRRIARCKGSPICPSKSCLYRDQYGCANRMQFRKRDSVLACFTCETPAEQERCTAVKVWEYDNNSGHLFLMYRGVHTCMAKSVKVSKEAILDEIEMRPGVRPSRLVNDKMVRVMSSNSFQWKQVEKVAEQFVDIKRIHNVRQELKHQNNPEGENFEALAAYKAKCAEKDQFLIFRVNNRALNGNPSYVFKSSSQMAELALAMDINNSNVLNSEYAYVDVKHNRCRGYKTLTLWTYHPVMRKLLQIAVMEIEKENSENLSTFWTVLNSMLEESSGKKGYLFNPCGFVADEHHANWISIQSVFGRGMLDRMVSCEFHYKQSVQRHAKRCGNSSEEFVRLAVDLLECYTVSDFETACKKMKRFADCHDEITNWFKWWYDRRTHIFRAFKPAAAPASNLAEVGHSKLASVGRCHMSLLEAAREDVASAIRQETEMRLFERGECKGGRGISIAQRKSKAFKSGMKRAKAYSEELEELVNRRGEEEDLPEMYLPKRGKHRPPEKCRQKSHDTKQPFHLIQFHSVINLKKCYGCGKIFKDKYKNNPHDIIFKHFLHRKYKNAEGIYITSRHLQAAYFHLKFDCVRKVVPRMETGDIIIHKELKDNLSEGHIKILEKIGVNLHRL